MDHQLEELGERIAEQALACDAGVVDVIEDGCGTPLSVGRKRRTIAGALKRALHKRDRTCTYPGCANHLYLEGHHIKHWADGGETSLDNGLLLCSFTTGMSTSMDTPWSLGPIGDLGFAIRAVD
jgi:hypothetical protein